MRVAGEWESMMVTRELGVLNKLFVVHCISRCPVLACDVMAMSNLTRSKRGTRDDEGPARYPLNDNEGDEGKRLFTLVSFL